MQAFYSLDDSADPPTIDATHSFEIGGGYAGLFSLATANSGYGELPDETARTVVVELIRDNKVAYGPFLIPIPNEMID